MISHFSLIVGLAAAGLTGALASVPSGPSPDGSKQIEIQSIEIAPPSALFRLGETLENVVVSAIDQEGFRSDITAEAKFQANSFVRPQGPGTFSAHQQGETLVEVTWQSHTLSWPVRVEAAAHPVKLSFVRDILPILSRSGCNGGSCHAKPNGQNGFALSVFAYDPSSDYHEIVKDAHGRRVFPSFPEESLILQKATLTVPHKGGKRLEPGSAFHQDLVRWMREGLPFRLPDEAELKRISLFPPEGRFRPHSEHQVRVTAHFEDETTRDITSMVDYAVSDKELLRVDEAGLVGFLGPSGQGVVLARYMGHITQLKVTVPSTRQGTEANWEFEQRNVIDQLAAEHFRNLGLIPSSPCSDEVFLRRAFLDGIGRLPRISEVRDFLADTKANKRPQWIRRILQDPCYGDFWANKWADLLRPNPDRVGVKSVYLFDRWLRDNFRNNVPYDRFVREIISHGGSNHGEGPAVVYRDRRNPTELTSMFSQLFLGVRMECAKCHHHPFEQWSQEDFYQFAAFFGSVKQKGAGLSPPISAGTEIFYFAPGGSVTHPVTDQVMRPKALNGSLAKTSDRDPRQALAAWLTESDNPYFARAIVNRVWAEFFSRGFVNPVDDFRDSNPPVNEPLLDALAEHFIAQNYDLKRLMATIMESSLYQLSSLPNESNLADTKNFSRFYRKRLSAETLLDAVCDVTGIPESFDGMPAGARAMETWTYKIGSHFLDAFSRPNSSSDPPCERDQKSSVVQALHLMHSQDLQAKLADENGWAKRLAESEQSNREIVAQCYLATLSRFPTSDEYRIAVDTFPTDGESRQTAVEDLLWALFNTAEFVFNH